jgi:hypothetical protein
MGTRRVKPVALGGVILVVMGLAACGSASGPGSSAAAAARPTVTPRQVTPKAKGGSSGQGPQVIANPATLQGGQAGSQKVVLGDRTLVISSVTRHRAMSQRSILIDLNLVVTNTSGRSIQNKETFFELVGPGGDSFDYQTNSSDNFYRTIGSHTSSSGMVEFEIPAAAVSSLYLLYRPEIAKEAVLTHLRAGEP